MESREYSGDSRALIAAHDLRVRGAETGIGGWINLLLGRGDLLFCSVEFLLHCDIKEGTRWAVCFLPEWRILLVGR